MSGTQSDLSLSSAAQRIGVCTDTHFWFGGPNQIHESGRTQLQSASADIQDALLAEFRRTDLDLVLHLGDVTCGGGSFAMPEADFHAALARMQQAFGTLPMPVYALPGNHDCPPGGGDWSHFENLWGLQSGQGVTIDTPAARLVLLNAQGHSAAQIERARPDDPVYGWVNAAELARLDHALATAPDRPVLLFTHQLVRPWVGRAEGWREFYRVLNADAVLNILARHGNVRGVFQGHAHLYDVQVLDVGGAPCTFVVVPAVIEYPMAWLQLALRRDALAVQLHTLPLAELVALSRGAGQQDLRRGYSAWQQFEIPFG